MNLFHSTAIALTIITGATSAVFAKEAENGFVSLDVKTETVSFADLDLTTSADAATLLDRVGKTARKVCQRFASGTGIEELQAARACFNDSYRSGISAINAKTKLDIEALAASTTAGLDVVASD